MSDVERGRRILEEGLGCMGLAELLRIPKPKPEPKKKFRVEWYKPNPGVTTEWGRFSHSYKRFDAYGPAKEFAEKNDGILQVWTPANGWRTFRGS